VVKIQTDSLSSMVSPRKKTHQESSLGSSSSLTLEPKCDERNTHDDADGGVAFEASTLMPRLPAGSWRSLRGCFDYSRWHDRERFLELDRALASAQCPEPEDILISVCEGISGDYSETG
jgi:hypothetical protein